MNPEEIENREFLVSMRGYARDQVDTFKVEAARAVRSLQDRLKEAVAELAESRAQLAAANSQLSSVTGQLHEAQAAAGAETQAPPEVRPELEASDPRTEALRRVAQETERILVAAEEVAEDLHEKAMREAAGIVTDARLRAEKIFGEVENAKRSAEQDLERIRDSRSMIASQMEDIGRRLAETVARLRVPVESPAGRQSARGRLQAEQRQPLESQTGELVERQAAERQIVERQAAERYAVERQAAQRLAAERQAEERQLAERQALQRQAEERQAAERQAAEPEVAAPEAPEQSDAEASGAEEMPAPEEGAVQPPTEAEAVPPSKEAPSQDEREAPSQQDREEAPAAQPAASRAPGKKRPAPEGPTESSSLSELLEEIRRSREKQSTDGRETAAEPQAPPAAAPAEPEPPPQPATPDPMLERRAEVLGDLPLQAARRLKRLFQEDHNDLLDRLRTRRGKGTLDDNLAPLPEQFARFQSGLSESLSKAFLEGRNAAGGGGTADPGKAVSNLVARQVVNPLRAEVARAVQGGLEAQDTPTAIAERASDVFRVWKGVRTELLGVGMVYAAFNQGLVDGWSRNPRIQKLWVASEEDECPNDVCAKNVAAGPVALRATFPSGHLTPPAHGGCTCSLKSV